MKEKIISQVLQIEGELWRNFKNGKAISLYTGTGSYSLFYHLLFQFTQKEEYRSKFETTINHLYERLNEEEYGKTYCSGLTGIAYLLNFYRSENILDPADLDESLAIFDESILVWVENILEQKVEGSENVYHQLDFIHGAMGGLHYLSSRAPQNELIKERVALLFQKTCQYIQAEVIQFNENRINKAPIWFNTGLAHGTTSHIIVLSNYLNQNGSNKSISLTIELCIAALISLESQNSDSRSQFPGKVSKDHPIKHQTNLGWCYGDQTLSLGLHIAAKTINDPELESKAVELALQTTKRKTLSAASKGKLSELGFCHGTIGIAYIHKRWHQITKNEAFLDMYHHFLQETLKLPLNPEVNKTSLAWDDPVHLRALLDGSCGIGIVMLDFLLDNNSLNWDRLFLLR